MTVTPSDRSTAAQIYTVLGRYNDALSASSGKLDSSMMIRAIVRHREAEAERCAAIADEHQENSGVASRTGVFIAEKIRATA